MLLIDKIAKLNRHLLGTGKVKPFQKEKDADKVSRIIYNELIKEKPSMIARYGATELSCIINYLGIKRGRPNLFRYLLGKELDWWWHESNLLQLENWSGFFPPTEEKVAKYCDMMLNDSKELDILVSWLPDERRLEPYIGANFFVQGLFLDPFWSTSPWTRALAGKKVLVVHPFAKLIEKQYCENREKLFAHPDMLPQFELRAIPAIQSLGGESNGFQDWFEALAYMEQKIDQQDYDIALLGCGAYGFPLAAHIKRSGKKAVHMGGSLQLLFGIIGKRWENPSYGAEELGTTGKYPTLINKYWVRPDHIGRPQNAKEVEGGCYW